jgi:hypothetical protein
LALKQYSPSPETIAFVSEHCAGVADPGAPRHVENYRYWYLANNMAPADADAGFRHWMLKEPQFARSKKDQRRRSAATEALEDALNDVARYGDYE